MNKESDISLVLMQLHESSCWCEKSHRGGNGDCLRCITIDAFLGLHPEAWSFVPKIYLEESWHIQHPLRGKPDVS